LDAELVRRGLARSRERASAMIADGLVRVDGVTATKAATQVDTAAAVEVRESGNPEYASRGGHKLAGALDTFAAGPAPVTVAGRRCLDAGASTGGFTDVLLRRGAASVIAVDVGYGQLAWQLRTDPRVEVRDRTNVRTLGAADVQPPVDVIVADLSFISLTTVLPALDAVAAADADLVLMVKPQFEVGRGNVSGGVVRHSELRAQAVRRIADAAWDLGWGTAGVVASPLPGPSGNVEYFVWLRRDADPLTAADLDRAIAEGPQ
jgi:23S rRNA (cytidine1920-2'-O)/16S rRNA (cytidine1409-2'-O)-methyltransferase